MKNNDLKHCLVTGGAGFIGKPLCTRLQQNGIRVRAWLRTPATGPWDEAVIGDFQAITVSSAWLEHFNGIDTIFHLAGIAHTDQLHADQYWQVNTVATETLMKLAIQAKVKRVIYFSSVKAIHPNDNYGFSKRAAEVILLKLGRDHGIHVCILQPALVYGPSLRGNLLKMLRAIENGRFLPIPETQNERSMVGLEDVIEAAYLSARDPVANGKIYVLSDPKPYSTRQIYDGMRASLGLKPITWAVPLGILCLIATIGDWVGSLTGLSFPLNSKKMQKLLGNACYSSDLIREELHWHTKGDFNDRLPDIIRVYKRKK
jgi:UDP-glucose 4-epimerase